MAEGPALPPPPALPHCSLGSPEGTCHLPSPGHRDSLCASTEAPPGHEGACRERESQLPPPGACRPAGGQPGEQPPQVEAAAPQETHMLTRWTGRRSERSRSPSGEATFDERRKGRVSRAEGPHLREEGNYSSWALARSRRRAAPAAPSVQRALPRTDIARLPDAPCRCTHHSPPQELTALLQNPGGRPAPHLPLTPHARPPADCSHPPGSTSRGCFTLARVAPATPGASRGLPTSPPAPALAPWPGHWGLGTRR